MSVATSAPAGASAPATSAPAAGGETCPLCGAPLQSEQEWCLSCGAAARTRMAATPGWRAPIVTLAVVIVLALGVLAAALIKLAADSGPGPVTTATVTTSATATTAAGGAATTPGGAATSSAPATAK